MAKPNSICYLKLKSWQSCSHQISKKNLEMSSIRNIYHGPASYIMILFYRSGILIATTYHIYRHGYGY